ncbi:MAG: SGNH/GDSL hydrolase family protein [Sulfuricurvum sp.]|nr:SGNH/GDSL hydrolase family protein [Sulfuricurvum sp.]
MKRLFLIIVAVLLTANVLLPQYLSAQIPQKISYQAVIRDNNNALVANIQVGMRISILFGSANGAVIYSETQTPTTNANGLVNIEIGGGTGFSTINWATNAYFIKTETDPVGGTNYIRTETTQLLSVPYALHAKKIEQMSSLTQVQIDALTPVPGLMVYNITTQQPNFYNGTEWRGVVAGNATGANKSYPNAVGLLPNNYLTEGNLDRLFTVFNKALNGGNVVIGGLGGSITEGTASTSVDKRYINIVYVWWKNTFPKANITLINAGIGSTASDYGAMRVNRDLLSKNPDFVVVDYAVNDATSEPEYKLSFEGVVRQILKAPQHPAVMLLFMTTNAGVNSQDFKIPVGIKYELPMVNYHDAVWPEVQAGRLIWSTIGNDYIHPNDVGHALTAEMICLALDKAYQKYNSANVPVINSTLPAPIFSNWYEFTSLYDGASLVPATNTGWTYDGSVASRAGYRSSTPGSVLTFQLSGKVIYFSCWKTNGNAGKVNVTVDGVNPVVVDSWFDQTTFSYRYMLKIANNLSSGNHIVRIELLADKNSLSTGNEFKVLCVGSAGVGL